MIIEFVNFLNEITTNKIKTNFNYEEVSHRLYDNEFIYRYAFISKNSNKYILDFDPLYEPIESESFLINASNLLKSSNGKIASKIISVEFTISGRTDNNFDDLTKKDEQYDVIGKISFLIENFINKHPEFDIYLIGYTTEIRKNSLYSNYYHLFNDFKLIKGKSEYFPGGLSIYFLKNKK